MLEETEREQEVSEIASLTKPTEFRDVFTDLGRDIITEIKEHNNKRLGIMQ